ncbi:hypothetical protein BO82DRAFT_7799 [Aspergillus uvarum CBS 121591]|uniref:Uncharacterized protein n=1 Tax=Aspergillus uvarum CBS 121591 TaxID=1448315 RepID=A0A319CJE5_9EURO|nr:hypothetical protein BO82DRAFT_7799 [Aspergillus uvarum CBS 121591]PYH84570.1 hypothetical protein BO82DRAFT_7799 [Aspergillus uvarum CBS 121591]
MSLSAETIIALLALLVACVPGIWFIVRHSALIRRWWDSEKEQCHLTRHEGGGSESFHNLGSSRQIFHMRSTHQPSTLPFFNPLASMLYRNNPARVGSTPQQLEATFVYYRAVADMVPDREDSYRNAGV